MGLFSSKKSSTSSISNNTENLSSANDAAGTVGDVYQGQEISVIDEYNDNVAETVNLLANIAAEQVEKSQRITENSLNKVIELTEKIKQPEVTLIEKYQKQVYFAIAGITVVLAIKFLK